MFVKLHGFILIFVLLHIVSIFILDFQHHFWPCIHFTWRFAVESYVHVLCKLPKAAKHHLGPIKTHVYPNEIEPVPVFMVAADKDRVPVYVNRTPHFCIHSNVIAVWVRHGPCVWIEHLLNQTSCLTSNKFMSLPGKRGHLRGEYWHDNNAQWAKSMFFCSIL